MLKRLWNKLFQRKAVLPTTQAEYNFDYAQQFAQQNAALNCADMNQQHNPNAKQSNYDSLKEYVELTNSDGSYEIHKSFNLRQLRHSFVTILKNWRIFRKSAYVKTHSKNSTVN